MSQRLPGLVLSLYIADLDGWLAHGSLSTSVKHAFHPVYNRVRSSCQQNQWDNGRRVDFFAKVSETNMHPRIWYDTAE